MRSVFLVLFTLLSSTVFAADSLFIEKAKAATALLYAQSSSGTMTMRCTATAFEKDGDTYRFVSASHCIGSDQSSKEKVAQYKDTPFYITFDDTSVKTFYIAKVKSVGYQTRGDDFVELEVEAKAEWPIIPLGDEKEESEGAALINIASPLGLGKQVFHGSISKLVVDRPIVQGDINWTGVMLLQLGGTNGGSSGSSIISEKQEKIVGFVVGTIGGTTITAIPVSRFKEFRERVKADNYRWMELEEDQ